ncbi:unnamed protein product [Blepharisma stoltei]|uniref:Receptor ligand binding region domain-containing protein n=1 Tax=Blepharisma stoltei TaxID=1481888 RepID=A0AAU9KBU1_9CILI|nr:unnamed protein product [Blepharisma stoltei]
MNKKAKISKNFSDIGFMKKLFFLTMFNLCSSVEIIIAKNDRNELNQVWIEEAKYQFESVVEWYQCDYSLISECVNSHPNAIIVLDLSNSFETQLSLSQLCKENNKVHLVPQKNQESLYDEWTYDILPSNLAQTDAYFATLAHFNWTHGLVITDGDHAYIKPKFLEYSETFDYITIESLASLEKVVNRIIKPLGATLYYIFTNSVLSSKIQETLKSKKLLSKGDGIMLTQNSCYDCKTNGAIIVTVAGQEYASSQEEFLISSFENLILYVLNQTAETTEELKHLLKIYSQKNKFSIVNIQDNQRQIVGTVSAGSVKISKTLIFPGNTTDVPKPDKKVLHMTVSGGSYNPGAPPVTFAPLFYYGAYTAWSLINEGVLGILTHFRINYFIFDCGVVTYDKELTPACFTKDIDKFGLAHISAPSSLVTIAEINIFKSLNLTFPVVGSIPDDYSLNSTSLYPMFTRVIISNRYLYSLASLLFRALGWRKICVLYSDDLNGRSGYSAIISTAEQYSIEILNSENSRVIPEDLNRTTIKNYSGTLQEIVDTDARLLVFFLVPPLLSCVIEELYDMGLRTGDVVIFVIKQEMFPIIPDDTIDLLKIKETGVPMMAISGKSWVGEVGEFAYSQIASRYNSIIFAHTCFGYDAAYLIGIALDYMINQGYDYTDPYKINSAIRSQKFTGCTGVVSIDKGSNDRAMDTFDIMATKIDTNSGNIVAYKMGEFRPFGGTMLSIKTPFIYGGGTTVKPDDLRNQNNKCPFHENLIRGFAKGRIIVFSICFMFALVSFAATAYIWKKWWNITIEELKEKQEMSLQDIIVMITIGIEFFQFAAMGPDIAPINSFLAKISSSLSLSLENIFALQKGIFWILINGVFGAILFWLVLSLVVLLSLDEKYPKVTIFRFLAWLADYLMPILGNLCFIPFVSMCLNVFICDHSIGDNFTDSFLAADCYYFCWKDEHLVYAIFLLLPSYAMSH